MPTEIKKNRPDDQMTSCFLKLYTPTRVCEIIIRNWSAGQLVSPKKPDDIKRRNERRRKPALNAGEWTKGGAGLKTREQDEEKTGRRCP